MKVVKFYINKIIAISYISILYVVISAFLSSLSVYLFKYINLYISPEDFDKTNFFIFILKAFFEISYVGVLAFFIRKIVKKIYYPFDKLYGFKYNLLTEFQGGVLFSAALLLYNSNIIPNIKIILNHIFYKNNSIN